MFAPSPGASKTSSESSDSYTSALADLHSSESSSDTEGLSNALEKYMEDEDEEEEDVATAVKNADKEKVTKLVDPMSEIGMSVRSEQSSIVDWEVCAKEEEDTRCLDFDEGLAQLETITSATERLLDDDDSVAPIAGASKRSIETTVVTPREKKARTDSSENNANMAEEGTLKKLIKQLSRKEIEGMVCEAVFKVTTSNSEVGRLREQCDRLAAKSDEWKKRAMTIQRHCLELAQVMKKYLTEKRNRPNDPGIAPIRITRSVKLQATSGNEVPPGSNDVSKVHLTTASNTMLTLSSTLYGTDSKLKQTLPQKITVVSNDKPLKRLLPSASNGLKTPPKLPIVNPATVKAKTVNKVTILSDDEDETITIKPQVAVVAPQQIKYMPCTTVTRYTNPNGPFLAPIPVSHRQVIPSRLPMIRPSSTNSSVVLRPQTIGSVRMYHVRMPLNQGVVQPYLVPLPNNANYTSWKCVPPRPTLNVLRVNSGITLTWDLALQPGYHAAVKSYQVFALQEGLTSAYIVPAQFHWKKIAEVDALALPMTCSLSHFPPGNRYHISMRAVDVHARHGEFCEPKVIVL